MIEGVWGGGRKAGFVMHLPVGRLVVMTGEDASIAALFRRAPGKDVVSVLTKTVEAIEENKAAATKTFGNETLAGKYAEALLKLLQKTSLLDRARELESSIVSTEGVVAVLVPRAAHLHGPQAQLDVGLTLLEVTQDQDPVREELLVEGGELAVVPGRDLRDQEARGPEGLQEAEEVEQVS